MAVSLTLKIGNMKCGGCVASVEQALLAVSGVDTATVSLEQANAVVTGTASLAELVKASTEAGYPASPA